MKDYLHCCLDLHPRVTESRYGKTQRLDLVERDVGKVLERGGELWEVIRVIYDHEKFDADMFGPLAGDKIEHKLKKQQWYGRWQDLADREIVKNLLAVFIHIEPVSMVLRFARPKQFGIYSSPVAALLGVRPRRKPTATYTAYLKSLRELRDARGFERIADVEMALWALWGVRVGVVGGRLEGDGPRALSEGFEQDIALLQIHARNLTVQLFSEKPKLTLAEALLTTNVPLAGQIAGIEFEQLMGKWVGEGTLEQMIDRSGCKDEERGDLHRARRIRNKAIHDPQSVTEDDVRFLIATARKVENWLASGGNAPCGAC